MKDPAVLFYSSDFLTGVGDLTMQERGQYITLLCLQHQKGRLSQKVIDINTPGVSQDVLSKFQKDDQGRYYNKRLMEETMRRADYKPYKVAAACLGGLISSHQLTPRQVDDIKGQFDITLFKDVENQTQLKIKVKQWFNQTLTKCLTIYEDETEDENITTIDTEVGESLKGDKPSILNSQFSIQKHPQHETLARTFSVSEINNFDAYRELGTFLESLTTEQADYHRQQLRDYIAYKEHTGQQQCGWRSWIDHKWNDQNYSQMLEQHLDKSDIKKEIQWDKV